MAGKPSLADGEFAAFAPLSSAAKHAKVAASTAAAELRLEAGLYRCFLEAGTSSTTVFLEFADALGGAAADVGATADNAAATYRTGACFSGAAAVSVAVTPDKPFVTYLLSTGTGTLRFVKLA